MQPRHRNRRPRGLPVNADDDGLLLSDPGAIVVYLAKKSGRLIPGDRSGEAQVMRLVLRRIEHRRGAADRPHGARLDG